MGTTREQVLRKTGRLTPAEVHLRELARHSAGIPKPVVTVSYCEGSLF